MSIARKYTCTISLLIFVLACAGCSTIEKGKRHDGGRLESLKTAYVVLSSDADRRIGTHIQDALIARGLEVKSGSFQDKPDDVGFFVTYIDRWQWDLTMYLTSLDIQFKDGPTGTLLASGAFRNGFFHSFPSPRLKAFEVIDSIYKAK